MKIFTHVLLSWLLLIQTAFAAESNYDIRQLALPSEVKDLSKGVGAIYYSPSIKGKVLIPVNIWGDVGKTGLHFVPVDTTLVMGLSLAGGPSSHAKLSDIKLNRTENGKSNEYTFDLSGGGTVDAQSFSLKPGDTIFVENDKYYENRAYYTSLIGVIATILSSVLLYREVKK
ncbi:MAG: hypothetical protein COW00_19405 [Bdellovibrio sp. CG12_big_fil_rev_8_21_14_0_65_39_13]|nr:MAG: hypothetical protein COW78_01475 [Bdellovibrio sp. CG22_combo_CG10-13_8_21_14_all_39_27]PIQ57728.1 MAG: hypothetical protein COW00_19405 [Bdellovibrio sp. CG12_big_fil_rev_8_21_14_0_65_39_13]PIR36542.1 MAG: hypothetical protein COV37_02560 [Bdellovibrio sp. CG11_big_fil_rev_8_21_14_0_20_39_38]